MGVAATGDALLIQHARKLSAKRLDRQSISLRHVPIHERRFAEGHHQVLSATIYEPLPIRRLDVMRFDLHQHLTVEVQRSLGRQLRHKLVETSIGVAAFQIVMEPGCAEPLLQRGLFGMLPNGVFIVR